MAHVKHANTNRHGNDDLEASPGYSPNGESQFSREATHGGYRPQVDRQISDLSRLDVLISNQVYHVERLERRLEKETDPAKVCLTMERLLKTRKFLDRLRREQRGL